MRIGLVDSIGGLDVAVKSAAKLAKITGDYEVREFPRVKSTTDLLSEMFERRSAPVSRMAVSHIAATAAQAGAMEQLLSGRDPAHTMARDLVREMQLLLSYDDPRGVYARMPFVLRVR